MSTVLFLYTIAVLKMSARLSAYACRRVFSALFALRRLGGRKPACGLKAENHPKIHRRQVHAALAEQKCVQTRKIPRQYLRNAAGFDAVWAHLCPSKL